MLYLVCMLDMVLDTVEAVEVQMFLLEVGARLVHASVVAPAAVCAYSSNNSMLYQILQAL